MCQTRRIDFCKPHVKARQCKRPMPGMQYQGRGCCCVLTLRLARKEHVSTTYEIFCLRFRCRIEAYQESACTSTL